MSNTKSASILLTDVTKLLLYRELGFEEAEWDPGLPEW